MSFKIKDGVLVNYHAENGETVVVIPEGITRIAGYSFCGRGHENIESVTIPNSVTSIGSNAFGNCYNLKSIVIPDSVTRIEDFAFSCCYGLESVIIGKGVRNIEKFTFEGCYNLKSVKMPESVTSIEESAFSRCLKLKTMTIPKSVAKIGENAFFGCKTVILYQAFCQILNNGCRCSDFYYEFKKDFPKIFKFAINNHDVETVNNVIKLRYGRFLTERNIDKFIEYADQKNEFIIKDILENYKNYINYITR